MSDVKEAVQNWMGERGVKALRDKVKAKLRHAGDEPDMDALVGQAINACASELYKKLPGGIKSSSCHGSQGAATGSMVAHSS